MACAFVLRLASGLTNSTIATLASRSTPRQGLIQRLCRLLSESGWLMTENFNVVRQFRAKFNGNGKLTDYRTARANMYRTYSPFKPTKCLD